ncbi:MAG: tetratricopeptide repeat protein [Desulfamplus sp.]|nr:tetratricopeptide repeat protein [Desulfamplus sp.]
MGRNEEKEAEVKGQESKTKLQEAIVKDEESAVKSQDSKVQNQEIKAKDRESRIKEQESKVKDKKAKFREQEENIEDDESTIKAKGKQKVKVSDGKAAKKASRDEASAADTDGQYSSVFYWHSFLLYCGRILHKVLDFYNQFFDLTPKDKAKLYSNISKHYINKGLYDKALSYLKEWSKVDPTNTEPLYQLGIALAASGNRKSAMGVFSKVLNLEPQHLGALHRRSSIMLKLKDFKAASDELEKALAIDVENPRFFYLYAVAKEGLGEIDKAIEALEKAIELDPDEIKYHQHLGFLNVSKDDHKTAAKSFTKVMELEREMEEEDDEESY